MTTVTLPREVVQQALDAFAPVSAYGKIGSRDIEQAALQTALSTLRAALDAPAQPVSQYGSPELQAMILARAAQPDLQAIIDDFLNDYEMIGETADGQDAQHTPTEFEKALIEDAIMGLLADPAFASAIKLTVQPVDCRGCQLYFVGAKNRHYCTEISESGEGCTNGDKFKPMKPIQLYKQEK